MPEVKSVSEIAGKWQRVTPQRTEDYAAGVTSPRTDWARSTLESASRQAEGVQKAIAEKRFEKGVAKAGTAAWQKGAQDKGTRRWGEGVQLSGDAYQQGFAPFVDTIQSTKLPPRFPAGDPRNIERTKAMAQALHNRRIKG